MPLFFRPGDGRARRSALSDPDALRRRMVEEQLRRRGLRNERVLRAMARVPRHLFVPAAERNWAYDDRALPIGHGQTISQPYIVALMTSALRPLPGDRALEIGTGSGYQAAVLAACGMEVFTVERIPALHAAARDALGLAGYLDHVHLKLDDGRLGWPEEAPFPRILITAAAEEVPRPLILQLEDDGLLVAPLGEPTLQTITRIRKAPDGAIEREALEGARFVPLLGDRDAPSRNPPDTGGPETDEGEAPEDARG